jgi:hypothetical protein
VSVFSFSVDMGNTPDSPVCDTTVSGKLIRRQAPLKKAFLHWDMCQSNGNIWLRLSAAPTKCSSFGKGHNGCCVIDIHLFTDDMFSSETGPLVRLSWSTPSRVDSLTFLDSFEPRYGQFIPLWRSWFGRGSQRHDLHQPVMLTSKGEPLL